MPPVYFFAIDVSAAAHACGMVSVVAQTIRACLDQLPGDERTQVGFLTYDSSLHFYNLKASLAAPQVRQLLLLSGDCWVLSRKLYQATCALHR
jgi:protein transport protein SEC24